MLPQYLSRPKQAQYYRPKYGEYCNEIEDFHKQRYEHLTIPPMLLIIFYKTVVNTVNVMDKPQTNTDKRKITYSCKYKTNRSSYHETSPEARGFVP